MKEPFYTPTGKLYLTPYELSENLEIPEWVIHFLDELELIPSCQLPNGEVRFYEEDLRRWSLEVEMLYFQMMASKTRLGIRRKTRGDWIT